MSEDFHFMFTNKKLEDLLLKVGLSVSKSVFNESPLRVINNAFYFILKAFLFLKIFIYLSFLAA